MERMATTPNKSHKFQWHLVLTKISDCAPFDLEIGPTEFSMELTSKNMASIHRKLVALNSIESNGTFVSHS